MPKVNQSVVIRSGGTGGRLSGGTITKVSPSGRKITVKSDYYAREVDFWYVASSNGLTYRRTGGLAPYLNDTIRLDAEEETVGQYCRRVSGA